MIDYRIVLSDPHTHLVDVTLEADVDGPVDLVLPAWIPGSYKIRDFAQNIQQFHTSCPWEKTDKNTWRIFCKAGRLRATWRAFGHELTVRTTFIDDERAHINPANVLMYIDGRKEDPCRLEVRMPRNWKVASALDPDGPNRFRAASYDILADAPMLCGDLKEFSFKVRGKPHRVVWHGESNLDTARLRRELPKIVETECAMMRVVPYDRYLFIINFTDDGKGGGLEHLNSTSLAFPRFGFRPDDRHDRFLGLCAHEFFHLWNVKRIRPQALGPFEYGKENYTRLLWAMEGVTSYYDAHFLLRSGLMKPAAYLKKIADDVERFLDTPGRRVQSLAESSFDAWIKFYNPGEHSMNGTISYYEKGSLVAALLDLEIRRRSKARKSLDDVLRQLWREYAARGIGFPEERYEQVCEEVAGASLRGFFDKYIRGTEDPAFDRYLAAAGLRLGHKGPKEGETAKKPWLGMKTEKKEGRSLVSSVTSGSPAHEAGINAGDELLALAGHRVDHDSLEKRLDDKRPGDKVEVAVFRGSRLRRFQPTVGARKAGSLVIEKLPAATAEQRAVHKAWLGTAWDSK